MESNFNEFIKFVKIEEVKSKFVIDYFEQKDNYGLKPIHWACLTSNIEILKWMLQENCDIETSSENGWRPIHFACYIGDRNIVQVLIENYCKIDCETNYKETPLNVANGNCNHKFIDEIWNDNINLKIGLSMGLKCDEYCDHKLCLRSVVQCNFARDEQIGLGRFAIIYKVTNSRNDQEFAVKKYCYDSFKNSKCFLRNINKIPPDLLNHSKIVKLFGMIEIEIEKELILFMELMDNGSLYDEIRKSGKMGDGKIGKYCKDILEAVSFLHSKEILHRCIDSKNILLDNKGGCKLKISSLSCFLRNVTDDISKDFFYYSFVAPEIINNKTLSYPYDIWWLGCTVIDMLTGDYLRYRWELDDELNKIMSKISNKQLKLFIESMIVNNSDKRASVNELLNHEFIRNIPSDDLCINQPISNNSSINRDILVNIIQNAIHNKRIGSSMGLECDKKCQHKFCLSSVTATNFQKGKIIGKGTYGKVYLMRSRYAMKIIENIDNTSIKEKYFKNNKYKEPINHENIVKHFGAVINLRKIFIFMEFIDGQSLHQKIKETNHNPLPLKTMKQYTIQILEGLKFLHNLKIIHRNIKGTNILIHKSDTVKISVFKESRFLRTISKDIKSPCYGTYNYMSPEIINGEPYGCSADIWSLGATVIEMATGHPPYHDLTENAVLFKIATTRKIEYSSNMSEDIKIFLDLMLNGDPVKRSSAESLLNDQFLK